MFKRKIYEQMKEWKGNNNGKTALLLEGARRVGKTTIVKEFAKNEYKSFIFIDFANVSKNILDLFNDISNLDLFFIRLQAETNIQLYEKKSAIIFDEIQMFPRARQAIKYLVADGRYDYIETGSLISIKKNVDNIVIPSEERKIEVHPLDFEEFCNATNLNYSNIRNLYELHSPIGDVVNRTLIRNFRLYVAVGGMPQAVDAFVNKKSFEEIDNIKKDIINLYENDLRKIDKTGRLSKMYESIPAQLLAKKNKFSFGFGLKKKNRKDDERLFDLVDSKTINCCYCLNDISSSLSLYTNLNKFKLYVGDTGLFVTMLFNDGNKQHEDIYKKLLSDKLELNLGYLYENVVAQMLVAAGKKLYYFDFNDSDFPQKKYEIDFIINRKNKTIPIEVKSNKINSHVSIDYFEKKYSNYVSQKYLVSSKDYFEKENLINIPYYLFPLYLE